MSDTCLNGEHISKSTIKSKLDLNSFSVFFTACLKAGILEIFFSSKFFLV